MKNLVLFLAVGMIGCGSEMSTVKYTQAPACTTVSTSTGAVITCPDGTTSTITSGTNGAQGPSGAVGSTGAQGPVGVGVQGNTGASGPQGDQGPQGNQGVAGATGATGPAGSVGQTGATGAAGSNGAAGQNGNGYLPGLQCDVYNVQANDENGTVNWNTLFADGTLRFSTTLANFNVPNESSNDVFASFTAAQTALIGTINYALDCSGWINVPESGSYTLTIGSDDGSQLAIDEVSVINMPDLQPYASKSATLSLFSGLHRINMQYFQGPPTNIGLTLSWQGPTNAGLGTAQTIPASAFTH